MQEFYTKTKHQLIVPKFGGQNVPILNFSEDDAKHYWLPVNKIVKASKNSLFH